MLAYADVRMLTRCIELRAACWACFSSAYARQHTSAYVSIRLYTYVSISQHMSAYGSIRQHTAAYVSIRQHTSVYVSIRQHTSACVSIRQHASFAIHKHTHTHTHTTSAYFMRVSDSLVCCFNRCICCKHSDIFACLFSRFRV
jgi:hypothetical protein